MPAGLKKVDEAGVIKALLDRYACEPLTYMFTGDTRVLHKRYIERDKTPERGQVNAMLGDIPSSDFERMCRNLGNLNIGGAIVEIDTTDFTKVDFEGHIERARLFINR